MKNKTQKLLGLWYACLIDHHKDKDCYFKISKIFCGYKITKDWLVSHDGYLYEWEYVTDSYESAESILQTKLIEQIKEECASYELDKEGNYTDKQKKIMKQNLEKLQELM